MDNQTQNNIPEYVKNLAQNVQDFVFDREWEKRTLEIAKKYSLNDAQSDTLADTVVLALIGLEKPETFLQTIIRDLGISKLLAEQVMSDLETRVFDYAIKQIEVTKPVVPQTQQIPPASVTQPQKISTSTPQPQKIVPPISNPVQSKVPEIRPVNTPVAKPSFSNVVTKPATNELWPEKAATPKVIEPVKVVVPMIEKAPITPRVENVPVKATIPVATPPAPRAPEIVQRPVPVPRFTSESTPSMPPAVTAPVNPAQNSIQNKLNSVVKNPSEPAPKAPERYTVDPYREPIN